MARKKKDLTNPVAPVENDEIPLLPPFDSGPFDVKIHLSDGTTEIMLIWARGPIAAYMLALCKAERWPREKIAMIVGMDH